MEQNTCCPCEVTQGCQCSPSIPFTKCFVSIGGQAFNPNENCWAQCSLLNNDNIITQNNGGPLFPNFVGSIQKFFSPPCMETPSQGGLLFVYYTVKAEVSLTCGHKDGLLSNQGYYSAVCKVTEESYFQTTSGIIISSGTIVIVTGTISKVITCGSSLSLTGPIFVAQPSFCNKGTITMDFS